MKSDAVKKGIQQAPHRSLFNALGLTEEEMKRPLIGIVNSYNEIVPGHMNLDKITEAGVSLNDIQTIFVTHKHMDHLFGILWVMRMICQKMTKGVITHDVTLYAHDELITLLRDLTKTLLPGKHARFLDEKLHLIEVKDGEKKEIRYSIDEGKAVWIYDAAWKRRKADLLW